MYENKNFCISHMKICVYFSMKIEFSIFHIENIGAYFTCEDGIFYISYMKIPLHISHMKMEFSIFYV